MKQEFRLGAVIGMVDFPREGAIGYGDGKDTWIDCCQCVISSPQRCTAGVITCKWTKEFILIGYMFDFVPLAALFIQSARVGIDVREFALEVDHCNPRIIVMAMAA